MSYLSYLFHIKIIGLEKIKLTLVHFILVIWVIYGTLNNNCISKSI